MRCLREQKWERKKKQDAGGAPELRYKSHEPSNKRWCPVELQGQGPEPKQWSLLWKALGRQVSAFPLASMCCDIAIIYPSSIPLDPVLRGQWHCPEVTISFLEARKERGIPGVTALEVNSYAYCLYQVWLSEQDCPSHMPEQSFWTQVFRKQQWVKGSGLSSVLPFPLFDLGIPCGLCGDRRLWGPVSRDPGRQNQEAASSSQTPWPSDILWQWISQMPRSDLSGLFLRCTSLSCFSAKASSSSLFQSPGTVFSLLELRTIFRKQHMKPFSNWL